MSSVYSIVESVRFEGPQGSNPLAYHWYDASRVVLGKTLAEHLRDALATRVHAQGLSPKVRSGRQERLENLVNRFV